MREFTLTYKRCDFEGVAKNVAATLVRLHQDVKELSRADWRKMLASRRSDEYDNILVDILNDKSRNEVQKTIELTEFFVRHKMVYLHFDPSRYFNCVFLIDPDPPFRGGEIKWQPVQYQPEAWIADEILYPILYSLERSGFGHFKVSEPHMNVAQKPVIIGLSEESLAFLRQRNFGYF